MDVGVLAKLEDHAFGGGGVEVEDGECGAADVVASEGHVGDIDFVIGEQGADVGDHAGAVFIFEQEEDAFGFGFDVASVDHDDAGFVAEESSGDRGGSVGVLCGDGDEVGELAAIAHAGFDDLEAEVGGEAWGVDFVDVVSADIGEEAFEDGAGDGGHIESAGFAAVNDAEGSAAFRGELGGEASEAKAEVKVGTE